MYGVEGLNSPEYDVSSLGVGRNGRGDGGKPIRVYDGLFSTCELGQTLFQLKMDVCRGREKEGMEEREWVRESGCERERESHIPTVP